MVHEEHSKLNNLNILLERKKAFNPVGRVHNEQQSQALDLQIRAILTRLDGNYETYPAIKEYIPVIADRIEEVRRKTPVELDLG